MEIVELRNQNKELIKENNKLKQDRKDLMFILDLMKRDLRMIQGLHNRLEDDLESILDKEDY